ncbi:MAG: VOC family protein [Pseudomonadota bacterium]
MSEQMEAFVLLWSDDVERLVTWAHAALGVEESWRAPDEAGVLEHAELIWGNSKISVNIKDERFEGGGFTGLGLQVVDNATVDRLFAQAVEAGAEVHQAVMESVVAYSFTLLDPDRNQWWVHAETGMLDQLRRG